MHSQFFGEGGDLRPGGLEFDVEKCKAGMWVHFKTGTPVTHVLLHFYYKGYSVVAPQLVSFKYVDVFIEELGSLPQVRETRGLPACTGNRDGSAKRPEGTAAPQSAEKVGG